MRREEENIDKNHITMSDDERPLKRLDEFKTQKGLCGGKRLTGITFLCRGRRLVLDKGRPGKGGIWLTKLTCLGLMKWDSRVEGQRGGMRDWLRLGGCRGRRFEYASTASLVWL